MTARSIKSREIDTNGDINRINVTVIEIANTAAEIFMFNSIY
jgi:hypothetical protein